MDDDHQKEVEDLRRQLAKLQAYTQRLEAKQEAKHEEESTRDERVQRFLDEDLNTNAYEADKPTRRPDNTVSRAMMAAIPTYNGTGGAAALATFQSKLEAAADQAELDEKDTLALATQNLEGQAYLVWQGHTKEFPRGHAGRWKTWPELRAALTSHFYPREHRQRTMDELLNLSQRKCGNDLDKYIEKFNTLLMELPLPRDMALWTMRFHSGLQTESKLRVMTMVPMLDDLREVQEAARRDSRISGTPARDKPIHGAGVTGINASETKRRPNQPRKAFKCYNCGKAGHLARDCQSSGSPGSSGRRGRHEKKRNMDDDRKDDEREPSKKGNALHVGCAAGDNSKAYHSGAITLDSGATRHMIPHEAWFTEKRPSSTHVWTAAKHNEPVKSEGTVTIKANTGNFLILQDAMHVPTFRMPLFSIPAATLNGLDILFKANGRAFIMRKGTVVATATRSEDDRLFYLDGEPMAPLTHSACATGPALSDYDTWHARLGHVSQKKLRALQRQAEGAITQTRLWAPMETCEPCQLGRQVRRAHPTSPTAYSPGEIIHADLVGPFPTSIHGHKYVLNYVEGAHRYARSYCLPSKECEMTRAALEDYLPYIERHLNSKVKIHRSDRGGEFLGEEYAKGLQRRGIKCETTVRETPQQNGVAERINRTIEDRARATMIASNLPAKLWDEVWNAMVYLYNRTPHSFLGGGIPYLSSKGTTDKINLDHLRIIGSTAYAHVPKDQRGAKLAPTAEKLVLVGYSQTSKAYRLWNPNTDDIVERFDVTIDELKLYTPDAEDDNLGSLPREPVIQRILTYQYKPGGALRFKVLWTGGTTSWEGPSAFSEQPETLREYCLKRKLPIPKAMTPTAGPVEDHDPSAGDGIALLAAAGIDQDPTTYREAVEADDAKQWQSAMQTEIDVLHSFPAWELVPRPANRRVLRGRWVFKKKMNPDGTINKYRARFVAQGYTQAKGIDFHETFSPVVSATALRAIIAIATHHGWQIRQRDVVLAYLNGKLEEELYMEQPEGFGINADSKVCRLLRALYGLKQSGRVWNHRLHEELMRLGLQQLASEPCIYVLGGHENEAHLANAKVVVAIYVDDILITGPDAQLVNEFEAALADKFKMTDGGNLSFILGVRVTDFENQQGRLLDQGHCTRQLLARFGMTDANPAPTPMEGNALESLMPQEEDENVDEASARRYAEAVGSLMWLSTMTRPDIVFATSFLARFTAKPTQRHWGAIKRVLRYLRGTIDHGIFFHGKGSTSDEASEPLVTYSDADWAGCRDTRASTTGMIVLYRHGAISWRSTRQKCVATSSCEAEFIAGSAASQETQWIRGILRHLDPTAEAKPTELMMDNNGAIELAGDAKATRRSKHIDIKYHHLRWCVANKVITIRHVASAENVADVFTKPLDKVKFTKFRGMMGIRHA